MDWIKQIERDEKIKFICVKCGAEVWVRMNIVMQLDAADNRNREVPPSLQCKMCEHMMIPEKYTGINGNVFTFEGYKELVE